MDSAVLISVILSQTLGDSSFTGMLNLKRAWHRQKLKQDKRFTGRWRWIDEQWPKNRIPSLKPLLRGSPPVNTLTFGWEISCSAIIDYEREKLSRKPKRVPQKKKKVSHLKKNLSWSWDRLFPERFRTVPELFPERSVFHQNWPGG